MKLYLVVRADLSIGQQAVQAAHALQEFNVQYPQEVAGWFEESNTLAILSASNEEEVGVVYQRAIELGIPASIFREPDRGNEVTAIAIGPPGRQLTKHLPLALKS